MWSISDRPTETGWATNLDFNSDNVFYLIASGVREIDTLIEGTRLPIKPLRLWLVAEHASGIVFIGRGQTCREYMGIEPSDWHRVYTKPI